MFKIIQSLEEETVFSNGLLFDWLLLGAGAPHALEGQGDPVAGLNDLLFSNQDSSHEVFVGGEGVLGDAFVNEALSDGQCLIVPGGVLGVDLRELGNGIGFSKTSGLGAQEAPVGGAQGLGEVLRVQVECGVPEGVQAADIILGGEFEAISTSVSVGIFGSESAGGMQWLMDVPNIVDQQSEVEAVTEAVGDHAAVGNWLWDLCAFQSTD